ncbi:52 kDa repressor of the inhibitor of the protein kinase-like [Teleopsis dalmanni]|uniref:52 kDa repressor of the inhibitor of the protein kinase-like n=1 Tax=Teleopsis dalmanni TaxID=139649 RepID=UPI0018CF3E82|nr:52 kDa repressor of the inhibitor of the protein kinase-like [Teleopsis dalmanni]
MYVIYYSIFLRWATDFNILRNLYDLGVLVDLMKLQIVSGDTGLEMHFTKASRQRATYSSPRNPNKLVLVSLCGKVVRDKIVEAVRKASVYSVLADETVDISGKDQLSIGVRFCDKQRIVHEKFLGYTKLSAMDSKTIAGAINSFLKEKDHDYSKCVGQGYDFCFTMAGKVNGVQGILRNISTKALFFIVHAIDSI